MVNEKCVANVGDIIHYVDRDLFCAAAIVIAINSDEKPGFTLIVPNGMIPMAPGSVEYLPLKEGQEKKKNTWHMRDGCSCKRIPNEVVASRIMLK